MKRYGSISSVGYGAFCFEYKRCKNIEFGGNDICNLEI